MRSLLRRAVLLIAILASTTLAYAQDEQQIIALLNEIKETFVTVSRYLGINIADVPPEQLPKTPPTPKLQQTQNAFLAIPELKKDLTILRQPNKYNPAVDQPPPPASGAQALSLNEQSIYNALAMRNPEFVRTFMGTLDMARPIPGETTTYAGGTPSVPQGSRPGDKALDADTLLGPKAYPLPQQQGQSSARQQLDLEQMALNFIRFVSGQANPLSMPPETVLQNAPANLRNEFLVNLRAYIAAQSMATSNLYQMLAKRHIYPGLGTKVGLKTPDKRDGNNITPGVAIPDASLLQVEDYLAQRRVTSSEWYKEMEKAPPITIERETLYTLAEIQDSLNETRRLNERILATLSVMQLLQLQATRTQLNLIASQVVQQSQH